MRRSSHLFLTPRFLPLIRRRHSLTHLSFRSDQRLTTDGRFHATLLWSRREMLHGLRPGLYQQGLDQQRGTPSLSIRLNQHLNHLSSCLSEYSRSNIYRLSTHTCPAHNHPTDIQKTCAQNCADKFLKHSERVGARFAEHNAGEYDPRRCV